MSRFSLSSSHDLNTTSNSLFKIQMASDRLRGSLLLLGLLSFLVYYTFWTLFLVRPSRLICLIRLVLFTVVLQRLIITHSALLATLRRFQPRTYHLPLAHMGTPTPDVRDPRRDERDRGVRAAHESASGTHSVECRRADIAEASQGTSRRARKGNGNSRVGVVVIWQHGNIVASLHHCTNETLHN
jgi:hypothetical protein